MDKINIEKILKQAAELDSKYSANIVNAFAEIASREPITDDNCDFEDIPWHDDDFSRRILPFATRSSEQTIIEADFIERSSNLKPGMRILDIASGDGRLSLEFARRGYSTFGIDKGKAGIEYSQKMAQSEKLTVCELVQGNAADIEIPNRFDLAMIIFGALANFTSDEASRLIGKLSNAVKPSGHLIIELCCLLDNVTGDYQEWYFTDSGLWGDSVYLALSEYYFNVQENYMAIRHWIIDIATGHYRLVTGREQYYDIESIESLLDAFGFEIENIHGGWDGREYASGGESMIVKVSRLAS
jgi:2-polyprenyl-3-methyl-5-hydroxy-6-metoxy-1,4-benzoquinol methylase